MQTQNKWYEMQQFSWSYYFLWSFSLLLFNPKVVYKKEKARFWKIKRSPYNAPKWKSFCPNCKKMDIWDNQIPQSCLLICVYVSYFGLALNPSVILTLIASGWPINETIYLSEQNLCTCFPPLVELLGESLIYNAS